MRAASSQMWSRMETVAATSSPLGAAFCGAWPRAAAPEAITNKVAAAAAYARFIVGTLARIFNRRQVKLPGAAPFALFKGAGFVAQASSLWGLLRQDRSNTDKPHTLKACAT